MDGIVPADGATAVLTLATSNRPWDLDEAISLYLPCISPISPLYLPWDLDEVRLPRTPYNTLTP